MHFIQKANCKLSVSNDSVIALSTYKIKSIFTLRFAADSSRCS